MTVLKSKHLEYKMRQNALCAGCGDNPCIPETCSKIGHLFAKQFMEERAEFAKDLEHIESEIVEEIEACPDILSVGKKGCLRRIRDIKAKYKKK